MENNKNELNNNKVEKFESKHDITDQDVINRLIGLKPKFEAILGKEITYDELTDLLDYCMNGNEMQIILLENEINGIKTTEEQDLAKYFEITTDERILIDLKCCLNCNEANLEETSNYFERNRKKDDK